MIFINSPAKCMNFDAFGWRRSCEYVTIKTQLLAGNITLGIIESRGLLSQLHVELDVDGYEVKTQLFRMREQVRKLHAKLRMSDLFILYGTLVFSMIFTYPEIWGSEIWGPNQKFRDSFRKFGDPVRILGISNLGISNLGIGNLVILEKGKI